MIVDQIMEYTSRRGGKHRSGSFSKDALKAIERHWPSNGLTIETGCGASTIIASKLSKNHLVFTLDDRSEENSSVLFVSECPLYRSEKVQFVFGPTQKSLPRFTFSEAIDAALIDGPHGFPFPELEYYFIYPHLRTGAVLIVDDVHIPTIFNFYRFLREEPMFEFIEKSGNTVFFRRTARETFDPFADGWWLQEFNKRRFPAIGRDEWIAQYFPAWLTKLFPPTIRTAVKDRLRKFAE